MRIRAFRAADVPRMREIWNEVVRAGNAFPQFDELADDALFHECSDSCLREPR